MIDEKIDLFYLYLKIFKNTASEEEIEDAKNKLLDITTIIYDTYGENLQNKCLNIISQIKTDALLNLLKYGDLFGQYNYIMRQIYKKLFGGFLIIIKNALTRNETMEYIFSYKLPIKNDMKYLTLYSEEVTALLLINEILNKSSITYIKDLPINSPYDAFLNEIKSIMFSCDEISNSKMLYEIVYKEKEDTEKEIIDRLESILNKNIPNKYEDAIDNIIEKNLVIFGNIMLKKIRNYNDLTNTYTNFINLLSKNLNMKIDVNINKDTLNKAFELIMKRKTPKQKNNIKKERLSL